MCMHTCHQNSHVLPRVPDHQEVSSNAPGCSMPPCGRHCPSLHSTPEKKRKYYNFWHHVTERPMSYQAAQHSTHMLLHLCDTVMMQQQETVHICGVAMQRLAIAACCRSIMFTAQQFFPQHWHLSCDVGTHWKTTSEQGTHGETATNALKLATAEQSLVPLFPMQMPTQGLGSLGCILVNIYQINFIWHPK